MQSKLSLYSEIYSENYKTLIIDVRDDQGVILTQERKERM